jgi:hypothetical protein
MLRRFENLDTDKIIRETMEQAEESIADKNAEQMFTGVRADNSDILPSYKDITIEIKQSKGQPVDRVTLRDTGAFYTGIRVEVKGDNVDHFSTDPKQEKLRKKYGEKIFGLNTQFKGEVIREDIQPVLKQRLEEATGLKMI